MHITLLPDSSRWRFPAEEPIPVRRDVNGQASTIRAERIAAGDLEPLVLTAIGNLLIDRPALAGLLADQLDAEATATMLGEAAQVALIIQTGSSLD